MNHQGTRITRRTLPRDASYHNPKDSPLCGLVLAGGEGKRLRSFIHLLRQDSLPKQYVNFIGRRSMMEHALHRAETLIPSNRVFVIINQGHLNFPEVAEQVSRRPPETVIVQPENKETGPGILFPLMHIAKRYPNAIVALLPSDHFVLEEEELMRCVRLAYLLVRRDASRVVMLAVEPDHDESEYGYILPHRKLNSGKRLASTISSFVEKPDPSQARQLMLGGALWNTMIMVFKIDTLVHLVKDISPALCDVFRPVYQAIGTPDEETVMRETYQRLTPINFSKAIVEPLVQTHPSSLLALPVRNVLWSDWGSESRVMEVLRKTGYASRLNGLATATQQPRTMARDSEPPFFERSQTPKSVRVKNRSRETQQRALRMAPGSAL